MKNHLTPLRLTGLFVAVMLLFGCEDDYDAPGPQPVAAMDWILVDGCGDGLGLQAALFDVTHGGVWPALNQVYFTGPGGEIDVRIACEVGALICYGAETDPPSDIFWGVGIDGNEGCDDCCEPCDDVLVEYELLCGTGLSSATGKSASAKVKASTE